MEYRLFYPINKNVFNTKWQIRTGLENRTDIYFILSAMSDNIHIEYGLKLRNEKKLELKIRQNRLANGQEYWIKTIHSIKKTQIDDIDSIIKILRKSNENQLVERLISCQPMIVCHVNKFREQKSIGNGLVEELTGLHLKFIRLNDRSPIGNDLFFETACVEQSGLNLINENILKKLSTNNESKPMGYPEFLFQQYQQIIKQ